MGGGGGRPGARPRFPQRGSPSPSRILPGTRPRSSPGAGPGSPPGARPGSPWSRSLFRCTPRGAGQVPLESARVHSALPARRRAHQRGRTRPGAGSRAPLCSAPGRRPRALALASPWCARSLPEPGLIWSRWRQAVGTAQPPQPACQYPAHNPPAARPRSHAHRARPLPPRDPLQIPGPRLLPTLRSLPSCQSSSKAWVCFRKCSRTRPPSPPIRPTNGFNLPYNHWSNDLQALQVACAPN